MVICKNHLPLGAKFTAFTHKIGKYHLGSIIPCAVKGCSKAGAGTIK